MRSLTTRSQGALTLVIAGRQSLTSLNVATQEFNRTGSPYFNFFSEITLGPFPDRDINNLLSPATKRFDQADRRFIATVASGHPYLLQVAASTLWETYEDDVADPVQRRRQASKALYDEAAQTLQDTWRLWPPVMRRALASVALPQMGETGARFHQERLLGAIADFGPELRSLEKQGFIAADETALCGWRVRPLAFVWWLADELVRTVRDDPSLETWLRAQEWDGIFTRSEKTKLVKAVNAVTGMLKGGATTLIELAAKGG